MCLVYQELFSHRILRYLCAGDLELIPLEGPTIPFPDRKP